MKKNNHKQIIADPEEAEISPVKELVKEEAMVYSSPIGFIQINGVVYTTEANPTNQVEYITSIRFFDTDPGATETASPTLKKAWEQIKAYFETGLKEFSFPILQPGTHFQMAVWKELMDIPYGKTISYLQLAQKLGDPKKIRAAGSANGKNNIAIVVPCHRVIGSTGELVGYAGSLWRKEWLLIHEGVLPKKLF